MLRTTLLAFALAATPLAAQSPGPAVIVELLRDETPEGRLAGAIMACAEIAYTPEIGEDLFNDGAWEPTDAEFEGTTEYRTTDMWAMFWRDPGFCMVSADTIGTDDALAVILAATDGWPNVQVIATGGDDCTVVDLGQGTLLQLTGPGQDPNCADPASSALRFTIADQ